MMMLLGLLLVLISSVSVGSELCMLGNTDSVSNRINNYSINEVYLNTGAPAACAGLVYNITYCYLVPVNADSSDLNEASFALWEPTGNQTYKQVKASISEINYNNDGCPDNSYTTFTSWSNPIGNEAKSIICRRRCFKYPLTVSQGTVLGLTLLSSDISKRTFIAETAAIQYSTDTSVCTATQTTLDSTEYECSNDSATNNRTLLLEASVYPFEYCDSLTPPTNGSINTTDTINSTVVSFTCNNEFTISTPLELACSDNQWRRVDTPTTIWDGLSPSCVPSYCYYPDNLIDHASIIISRGASSSLFLNSSIVTFQCDIGYHLYSASTVDFQCVNGVWILLYYRRQHTITCYPYECPLPDNIDEHGHLLLTSNIHTFPVNTTVRFSCDEGYRLSSLYPLLCLSNGTWNDTSPQCYTVVNDNNNGYAISENYRFLIVAVVVVLFAISFGVICLLTIFLAKKRGSASPTAASTLDRNESLKQQLIPEDTAINDEISPYSVFKMAPMQVYVSAKDGTVAYVNRPLSSNYSRPPSALSSHGSTEPTFTPPPLTLMTSPPYRFSGGGPLSPFPPENPLEELEQSLKSETPYWSPARMANELYLQLDQIKVKTIPGKNLRILEELGHGEFAIVNKGLLKTEDGEVPVAIKLAKNNEEEEKARFLREAAIMGQFNHSNILKIFGVVIDKPDTTLIVVEYMAKGDLLSYLQELKTKSDNDINGSAARGKIPYQLLNFTRQICLGMTYLSGKGFVHRDLAARNILVSEKDVCKIADFGLSRDLEDESYYIVHEGAVVPVKWTAPEAIQHRKYSMASDVWSYGCTLYEIWSLGCKPFKGASTISAIKIIKTGQRLTPPPGCPREIYQIMINTWHPNPKERPSFNDIMLALLKSDEDLLIVPQEERTSQPKANELGSDLKNGINLYIDLQNMYLNK